MALVLTQEQQVVAEKFKEFLNSDNHIFMIKGSAGTGKTTLLKYLIEDVSSRHIASLLMAPTGRASMVLSDKTNVMASTIHRTIYLLNKDKAKVEDAVLFGLRTNETPDNAIYFVDEASMISDIDSQEEFLKFGSGRLLHDLITYTNFKGSNRKMVLIGDYAQLPPIGQNFSPALSEEYLRQEFGVLVQSVKLTTVVRQALDSGVYSNADTIRKNIDEGAYNQFGIINYADVVPFTAEDFLERYNAIKDAEGEDNVMVITASNAQALGYNEIIRNNIYGEKNLKLQVGDLLLVTQNNYSQENILFNGSFVRVCSVCDEVETLVALVGKDRIELNFRSIEVLINAQPFRYYILDDFLTDREGKLNKCLRDALWANFEQRMRLEGIYPNTEEFQMRKRIDPYYNALHCKYGYAITCHKSQGGEWNNVFVDMDAYMGRMTESYFRWAYTAVTRAKGKLLHTCSPAFNAINQFVIKPIISCKAGGCLFNVPQGADRKDVLFSKILELANSTETSCSESRHVAWQHRVSFTTSNESCLLSLWENSKHYTGKIDIVNTTSSEYAQQCKELVKMAMCSIDFVYMPKFDFQAQMHNHIVDVINECGLRLTNVEQSNWCDEYYIATDAETAYIKFYYNAKNIFTYAQPYSTLGTDDKKLQTFIENL